MMQHDPRQPYTPTAPVPGPQSNRKLWIILGSVAGALILLSGGCVACGALLGLSSLRDNTPAGGGAAPVSVNTSQATSSRPGAGATARGGAALAGNWKGKLQCDNGESLPADFKIAGSGMPVYQYETKGGTREVELTSAGQQVRFVPPGGGVTTLTVREFSASRERINYAVSITGERASGGTLDQSEASVTTEAVLSSAELDVEMSIRSAAVVSQPGIVVPGDESAAVCRGKLRKD